MTWAVTDEQPQVLTPPDMGQMHPRLRPGLTRAQHDCLHQALTWRGSRTQCTQEKESSHGTLLMVVT
eukprot:1909771-Rhodomonas_salina.1